MLNAIHYTIVFGVLALIAFYAFEFYRDFVGAPGSLWTRLLAAGKGSATLLWSRFLAIFSGGVAVAGDVGGWFGAPGVADSIQHYLKPEYVPLFVLFVALVTEVARRRTL